MASWDKVKVKETTRLWAGDEKKTDFTKPFTVTCETTIKDSKKWRKLFCPKKHRLPRKLKKRCRKLYEKRMGKRLRQLSPIIRSFYREYEKVLAMDIQELKEWLGAYRTYEDY